MERLAVRKAWFLILPAFLFLTAFFLAPLAFILVESFAPKGEWSFSHYVATLSEPGFRTIYLRSLRIGILVTLLAVVVGYPSALAISRMGKERRTLVMSLVILPLMTSPVARTYAWFVVMGRFGIVNQTLLALGLIDRPLKILYTEPAILVGLLQLFLPLMLLSLVSALENVPPEVPEAAQSLGANSLQTFFRITLPLSADGLVIGGTLVFTGSITAYVTPAVLGGTRVLMLSTLLYQKAMTLMDWGGATVVAIIMLATTLVINWLLRRFRPKLV